MASSRFPRPHATTNYQSGASLIMALLILVIVSILGVSAAQIASMAERGSRNDRDMQIAWQASEAALMDAEFDIHGPNSAASNRLSTFTGSSNLGAFAASCGSGERKGLCAVSTSGKPTWLAVDFTDANTVAQLGEFTGRSFAAGTAGPQPALKPRYIIEALCDTARQRDRSDPCTKLIYRITAMGFGPREDIQAVTQTVYRN
ncbi:pilus assembly PilX family protein [Variovorax sp. JS1663]|uniref:pilus assembly PilX family protein n=1 Tax=Variovorax sp. JS1663 TaxID=1851577 RepID=UPI003FD2E4E3